MCLKLKSEMKWQEKDRKTFIKIQCQRFTKCRNKIVEIQSGQAIHRGLLKKTPKKISALLLVNIVVKSIMIQTIVDSNTSSADSVWLKDIMKPFVRKSKPRTSKGLPMILKKTIGYQKLETTIKMIMNGTKTWY